MAEGYHDFVAGETLTAANLEDYTQNQSVMRFASAAARDTALSVVKTEGMTVYLEDVNTYSVYSGTTWSTVGPVQGALLAWTPVVTQSGNVTVTNTVGWYARIGRLVIGGAVQTVTGSGTASNLITMSLPVTALGGGSSDAIGSGYMVDASVPAYYPNLVILHSATTVRFDSTTSGITEANARLGSVVFTAGLANTDTIGVNFAYQAVADA